MVLTEDDIRFLTAARQFLERTQLTGAEARVWVAVTEWLERTAQALSQPADPA